MAYSERRRSWLEGRLLSEIGWASLNIVSQLLISRDSKRTSKADELALLKEIKAANPLAGTKYLEYLVLQKRNQVGSMEYRHIY